MARKKRSAARASAAVVDSAEASKKAKPDVHEVSFKVVWPLDTSPQIVKLDATQESILAARTAKAAATKETKYQRGDFKLFAPPFKAAIASAVVTKGRPVSWTEAINEMMDVTKSTLLFKGGKSMQNLFAWSGFEEGQWQISRDVRGVGLVAYPKGAPRDKAPKTWRFSPSPAARRLLANLSK